MLTSGDVGDRNAAVGPAGGGSLSAPSNPIAAIRGPFRGTEEKGRRKGSDGRKEEAEGKGRVGKGERLCPLPPKVGPGSTTNNIGHNK